MNYDQYLNFLNNDVAPKIGRWFNVLEDVFTSKKMYETLVNISYIAKKTTVFPSFSDLFQPFELCNFDDLKVVIIGQEPYNSEGADGLAFSYDKISNQDVHVPDESEHILNLVTKDEDLVTFLSRYESLKLDHWAKQGVLLLNSYWTVEKNKPFSHKILWEGITKAIISRLNDSTATGIIYVLWGKDALKYKKLINTDFNYVLKTSYPSNYSVNKGFLKDNHFAKINKILFDNYNTTIQWLKS